MITTILIQIILVGTNVCINVLLLCEDAVTGENQRVRLNDHMTITLAPHRVSNLYRSSEKQACYHCTSQAAQKYAFLMNKFLIDISTNKVSNKILNRFVLV